MREFCTHDVDAFMEFLKVFFADIPYDLSNNMEHHYQVVFLYRLHLDEQFVDTEVYSYCGRTNAVVRTPKIYLYLSSSWMTVSKIL